MPKDLPTPETLRKLLQYDPETGLLFWKERGVEWFSGEKLTVFRIHRSWNAKHAGREAFTAVSAFGYRYGHVLSNNCKAHRVAWAIYYGQWPKRFIDHINGIPDDNRIKNLRDVSVSENLRNSIKSSNNTSGFCGVSWNIKAQKWRAYIKLHGKNQHLGYFESIEDAAAARKLAEVGNGYTERHGT